MPFGTYFSVSLVIYGYKILQLHQNITNIKNRMNVKQAKIQTSKDRHIRFVCCTRKYVVQHTYKAPIQFFWHFIQEIEEKKATAIQTRVIFFFWSELLASHRSAHSNPQNINISNDYFFSEHRCCCCCYWYWNGVNLANNIEHKTQLDSLQHR